jgi:hypothetical protein
MKKAAHETTQPSEEALMIAKLNLHRKHYKNAMRLHAQKKAEHIFFKFKWDQIHAAGIASYGKKDGVVLETSKLKFHHVKLLEAISIAEREMILLFAEKEAARITFECTFLLTKCYLDDL